MKKSGVFSGLVFTPEKIHMALHVRTQWKKQTFMIEKPPPSTFSLSMALMTSSSVMGSALDPLLRCKGDEKSFSTPHIRN